MSFDAISGHEIPKRILRTALRDDRVAHAYLFCGPEGIGKRTLALRFAAAVLRGHEVDESDSISRRIAHDTHPDVVLFSCEEGSDTVGVDRVRELETEIARRPFEGSRRVFLLDEAHRLTESAANALLKTLEEPPEGSVLILLADRMQGIPTTVLSRCQPVTFRPIEIGEVERWLVEKHEIDASEASWLSACSEGSIGRAIRLAEEDWGKVRSALLRRIHSGAGFGLDGAAYLSETCRKSASGNPEVRARVRTALQLLALAGRDMLVLSSGGSTSRLYHADQAGPLEGVAHGIGAEGANRFLEVIFAALEALNRNGHIDLLLETMALDLDDCLRPATSAK